MNPIVVVTEFKDLHEMLTQAREKLNTEIVKMKRHNVVSQSICTETVTIASVASDHIKLWRWEKDVCLENKECTILVQQEWIELHGFRVSEGVWTADSIVHLINTHKFAEANLS